METRDHDCAVALHAGDFLPCLAAPGRADFERWADVESFRLRSTFLRTATALVRPSLNASQFSEAVAMARRVRDTEPTSEAGWRLLIEALVCAGDRGAETAVVARGLIPRHPALFRFVPQQHDTA